MDAGGRAALESGISRHLELGELREAAALGVRGYGPEILGYLVTLQRDEELAAESFSRFAEDLWKGIARFRGQSSFRTWAYRIAWSAARDDAGDAYRRRGRRLETGEMAALVQEVRSRSAEYLQNSARERLERLRSSLEPAEQTLLILRLDRQLSWIEVAEVLSAPPEVIDAAAARKRFERLKEKLRKLSRQARP